MIGGKKGCLFSGLFGFHCSQGFFLNITKAKAIYSSTYLLNKVQMVGTSIPKGNLISL